MLIKKRVENFVARHPRAATNVLIAGTMTTAVVYLAHKGGYRFVRPDGVNVDGQPILRDLFGGRHTVEFPK